MKGLRAWIASARVANRMRNNKQMPSKIMLLAIMSGTAKSGHRQEQIKECDVAGGLGGQFRDGCRFLRPGEMGRTKHWAEHFATNGDPAEFPPPPLVGKGRSAARKHGGEDGCVLDELDPFTGEPDDPGILEVLHQAVRVPGYAPQAVRGDAHSIAAEASAQSQGFLTGERDAVEQAESIGHDSRSPRSVGVADAIITLHPIGAPIEAQGELLEEIGIDRRVGVDDDQGIQGVKLAGLASACRSGIQWRSPSISGSRRMRSSTLAPASARAASRVIRAVVGDDEHIEQRSRIVNRPAAPNRLRNARFLVVCRNGDEEPTLGAGFLRQGGGVLPSASS